MVATRASLGCLLSALPVVLAMPIAFCRAQTGASGTGQSPAPATVATTLSGTVVNALNGSPIPRALVSIAGRSVLTDSLGRFVFPSFTASSGSVQVSRPGYAVSPDDPGSRSGQTMDLTGRLELKLYPDAVIMGVVTGSERQPIEHAQIILQRENFDENGPQTIPIAFSQTDSHGEYRFNEPPGRYRLSIGYSQRAGADGTVMLPIEFPEASASEAPALFTVLSNEERRIDLHPKTAVAYPVRLRIEGDEIRYNPRLSVKSAAGASFSVFARNGREPGIFEVALPSGSYQLRATMQNGDQREEAEAHLAVNGHALDGPVLHFNPLPSIPVELSVESTPPASGSNSPTPPRLNNLGLRLQGSTRPDQFGASDVALGNLAQDHPVLEVAPGVYRLRAQFLAQWYVRSATYGGIDLLTQPITVSDGAAGEPLRLIIADDMGVLTGKVTAAVSSPATSYLYLLAHQPSLTPVVQVQTGPDGSFNRSLPPGGYTAYAFARRFPGDLHNPEVSAHLGSGTEVTIPASGNVSLEVPVQVVEMPR